MSKVSSNISQSKISNRKNDTVSYWKDSLLYTGVIVDEKIHAIINCEPEIFNNVIEWINFIDGCVRMSTISPEFLTNQENEPTEEYFSNFVFNEHISRQINDYMNQHLRENLMKTVAKD